MQGQGKMDSNCIITLFRSGLESQQRGKDIQMDRVLSDASDYYPLVHLGSAPNLHSEMACHGPGRRKARGQLGKDKYHIISLICGLK